MSDIKRYSPIGGAVTLEFDGHYVKYSDHEKQLSVMREFIAAYDKWGHEAVGTQAEWIALQDLVAIRHALKIEDEALEIDK